MPDAVKPNPDQAARNRASQHAEELSEGGGVVRLVDSAGWNRAALREAEMALVLARNAIDEELAAIREARK